MRGKRVAFSLLASCLHSACMECCCCGSVCRVSAWDETKYGDLLQNVDVRGTISGC